MSHVYGYKKPIRRHHPAFKFYFALTAVVLLLAAAGAVFYFYDMKRTSNQKTPVSAAEDTYISGTAKTFKNNDFQFKDSANWVLVPKESSANKYTYYQYRGQQLEHQLIVYVNQVPIPLYLATARVLPVRIMNNDSFDVLNVSEPCGKSYGPGKLRDVKEISIDNALMLCDPETPQYTVVLSESGADYIISLKKSNGTTIQFVITYKNQKLEPNGDTLKNIASSFKAI